MPSGVLCALLVVLVVGASLAGLWLVRRSTELESLSAHNDVAGFIIAVVGVVYGVMLAFVVVIVWERFDAADEIADREATLVEALYRDAAALTGHVPALRSQLRSYARSVVEDEWPAMASSQDESERTDEAMAGVFSAYRSVDPANPNYQIYLDAAIGRLDDLAEARRARISASSSQLPQPLWVLVLVGGLIVVAFTYFFAVSSFRAHGLMVAALAAMIALTVFLIVSLTFPYSGDLAVAPDGMRDTLTEFAHLDAAS